MIELAVIIAANTIGFGLAVAFIAIMLILCCVRK